ncbi:MAG: DNA-processing protein DprA [Eubacteriales bacterium]|nr:DNA-processing protein DprA [Eubacteriales bacterium]
MKYSEKEALFTLMGIENLTTQRIRKMKDFAGSYSEVLGISESEYVKCGIINPQRDGKFKGAFEKKRTDKRYLDKAKRSFEGLNSRGIRMVDYTEEGMPNRILAMPDPPLALFVKGELPDDNKPAVSIIGARICSEYGREVARYMSRELASRGVQIVSGMALGIDSAAAEGALSVDEKTYAVLGSGVDICYPKESIEIYRSLTTGSGGVISEYVPGSAALGWHFVQRNRLIAGLSDVLLVIEAKLKSGTATTVNYAMDQGKDVFALPGRITDPLGRGCNQLIRDGAMVLTNPADVLDYLGLNGKKAKVSLLNEASAEELTDDEKAVFAVMDTEPMHIEEIAYKAGRTVTEAIVILSDLEQKGCARQSTQSYYVKRLV